MSEDHTSLFVCDGLHGSPRQGIENVTGLNAQRALGDDIPGIDPPVEVKYRPPQIFGPVVVERPKSGMAAPIVGREARMPTNDQSRRGQFSDLLWNPELRMNNQDVGLKIVDPVDNVRLSVSVAMKDQGVTVRDSRLNSFYVEQRPVRG